MSDELKPQVQKAVAHFWRTRLAQDHKQGRKSGRRDAGSRTAVTGGRQLDGFLDLVKNLLCDSGLCEQDVHVERKRTILPGYFRATKEWDIVATVDGRLLATIEFKSQVGPSFGNNFNNRTEEAVGSAHDLWVAYREGAFRESPRPWLGYLMLLEDCEASRRPVSVDEPHFSTFPEFHGAPYAMRYQLLCQRLIRERLYDAACLLLSDKEGGTKGLYHEPSLEISINRFASSLAAHAQSYARFEKP